MLSCVVKDIQAKDILVIIVKATIAFVGMGYGIAEFTKSENLQSKDLFAYYIFISVYLLIQALDIIFDMISEKYVEDKKFCVARVFQIFPMCAFLAFFIAGFILS
jgi:hypothetical protein